jgi:hypothetical protein
MRRFKRNKQNEIVCDDDPGTWLTEAMRRPSDFAYFGESDEDRARMFVTWSLGPVIEHRDSDVTDRANAEALRRFLASDPSLEGEYRFTECSHWAVGHVTHVSFHAYDSDKRPTRIARILAAWFKYLRDEYPIADDDLHSEMEREEANEIWAHCFSEKERIEYIRKHRYQFEFHTFADMLSCIRGKHFAGYASELINR